MKKNANKIKMDTNNIEIDIRSEYCLYVKIGDWTVYLDDGTKERIITHWLKNGKATTHSKKQRK